MYGAGKKKHRNKQRTVKSAKKLLSFNHDGYLLRSVRVLRYFDQLPQQNITQNNKKIKEASNSLLLVFYTVFLRQKPFLDIWLKAL